MSRPRLKIVGSLTRPSNILSSSRFTSIFILTGSTPILWLSVFHFSVLFLLFSLISFFSSVEFSSSFCSGPLILVSPILFHQLTSIALFISVVIPLLFFVVVSVFGLLFIEVSLHELWLLQSPSCSCFLNFYSCRSLVIFSYSISDKGDKSAKFPFLSQLS